MNVISIEEYKQNLICELNEILKECKYIEVCRFITLLPDGNSNERTLNYFGCFSINGFYKKVCELFATGEYKKIEDLYTAYIIRNVRNNLSFKEFIIFSRLLNTTFDNYDHNKIRYNEKVKYSSGSSDVDSIVNSIIYRTDHKEHPNAYEVTTFKLNILLQTLEKKKKELLVELLKKVDIYSLEKLNVDDFIQIEKIKKNISNELSKH